MSLLTWQRNLATRGENLGFILRARLGRIPVNPAHDRHCSPTLEAVRCYRRAQMMLTLADYLQNQTASSSGSALVDPWGRLNALTIMVLREADGLLRQAIKLLNFKSIGAMTRVAAYAANYWGWRSAA